jgi:hypothetical protein
MRLHPHHTERCVPEITGLFPIPVMRVDAALDSLLASGLATHFSALAGVGNQGSAALSHTRLLHPGDSPLLVDAAQAISPRLGDFGLHLFGERLGWSIKEMWVNVLEPGGRQVMHNHANSFVSGVVYLTPVHPQACTVFIKSPGGTDFAFRNDHPGVTPGPYNAQKWVAPLPGQATWSCSPVTSCTKCHPTPANAASPLPSMRSLLQWIRGATKSRSRVEACFPVDVQV